MPSRDAVSLPDCTFQLLGIEMCNCFILIRAFLRVALGATKQIQPTLEKVIRLPFLITLTKVGFH